MENETSINSRADDFAAPNPKRSRAQSELMIMIATLSSIQNGITQL